VCFVAKFYLKFVILVKILIHVAQAKSSKIAFFPELWNQNFTKTIEEVLNSQRQVKRKGM
jgi:hypothetical protein